MPTPQYGAFEEYKAGDLAIAMSKLALQLEQQFPRRSATWLQRAPDAKQCHDVGFVAWKLRSDVPPLIQEK